MGSARSGLGLDGSEDVSGASPDEAVEQESQIRMNAGLLKPRPRWEWYDQSKEWIDCEKNTTNSPSAAPDTCEPPNVEMPKPETANDEAIDPESR